MVGKSATWGWCEEVRAWGAHACSYFSILGGEHRLIETADELYTLVCCNLETANHWSAQASKPEQVPEMEEISGRCMGMKQE